MLHTGEPRSITRALGHFGAILYLGFKTSPTAKLSFENESDLHENELLEGGQWFRRKVCFDIEEKYN